MQQHNMLSWCCPYVYEIKCEHFKKKITYANLHLLCSDSQLYAQMKRGMEEMHQHNML